MPTPRSHPVEYRQEVLFGSTLLPVYTNVVTLQGDLEIHSHDFLEIAVISAGYGQHVTSSGSASTRPGDIFVLRPGAWHGFSNCDQLVVANCCVGTEGLAGELACLQTVPELRELLWTGPVGHGRHCVGSTAVPAQAAHRAIAEIRR